MDINIPCENCWVMKEQDVRQRIDSFMNRPRAAALLVSGLVGLACSNSGLKGRAGDAEAVSGGPAGGTISSETGGGTIASGGAGGSSIGVPVSAHCGNDKLDPGEECDDGVPFARKVDPNGIPFDDGCSALCQIEVGWQCPTPGQPCIPCDTGTMNVCDAGPVGYCGDGIIQMSLGEECDMGPLNGVPRIPSLASARR
jgi:hypothetical protein